MQVLGLSWDFIRAKAVKLLGEPAVKVLETTFTVFQILIKEGPAALWEYAKEQFTDLKDMLVEQIKDMIVVQVVKAGIKWIVGLLNPVGAFIKAAMAIYEIVKFFIDKAKQIGEFIEAIIDAVAEVAKGSIGGAAKRVEDALARALPLIIGLLASLLGVSGLATKVQKLFASLRKRVERFIDGLILKAKKLVRKVAGKLKGKDREKVLDKGEAKRHEQIGTAVANELAKPPAQGMTYEDLRAVKQKQAADLIKKYGGKLKKPVRLTISIPPAEEDRKDEDLDFTVRIAPNDFRISKAVKGKAGGTPPAVGTYSQLESKRAENQENHHVPPKGLLGWINDQAKDELANVSPEVAEANPWLKKIADMDTKVFDPGDPLAAISIDKHTHIKKTGKPKEEAYRAHWGEGTAKEVFSRLAKKGLRLIYRSRFEDLDKEDKEAFRELAAEANESPAALSAAEEQQLASKAGEVLSTQFFKTELRKALAEERKIQQQDIDGARAAIGRVAAGAFRQSYEAVAVALEKSNRDGTKPERQSAMTKLKPLSKSTWNSQDGIDELNIF
jgi:hypothetical protein